MHFTLIKSWDDVYSRMNDHTEMYDNLDFDEKIDRYVRWWTNEVVPQEVIDTWICDRYEVGWRWRNYFRLKKWKKRMDVASPFDKPGEVLEWRAAQCLRWDVDMRRMWKFAPFSYVDFEWEYHKCPEVFEEEFKTDAEHWKQRWGWYYDVAKFTIADAKYKHEFLKWFNSIPKDEVITLIDYHD